MSKVFVDVGVSLDGHIAGPNRGPNNPLGDGGTSIHQWAFQTASFLERLGLQGGQTSPDELIVRIDPGTMQAALSEPGTRVFDMTGRPMTGWLLVGAAGLKDEKALAQWV